MLENDVRTMSHEELVQAVLRLFSVPTQKCEDWNGDCYIPDELADAFRGRNC